MSFEIVTSSWRAERRRAGLLRETLRLGGLAGAATIAFALVGAYEAMDKRFLVEGWLTLSQTAVALMILAAGFAAARNDAAAGPPPRRILMGGLAGLAAAICLALLVLLVVSANLRQTFVAASPALVRALALGAPHGSLQAYLHLVGFGLGAGLLGGALGALARRPGRAASYGLAGILVAGLFRDVFSSILDHAAVLAPVEAALFGRGGVTPLGAALAFLLGAALSWRRGAAEGTMAQAAGGRRWRSGALVVAVLVLPLITNDFVAQVAMLVALYVLMGLGLNIELGLAGLVDLGFVAFFAVGAYTVALLCSTGPLAVADVSFWTALPVAILLSAAAGLLFGLPVLRVRGDYLAMATLGLGEIVRVLVLSDALAPVLGGSQGIIEIDRPRLGDAVLNTPAELYYLALALAGIVAFVSWRLERAKAGRAWLAIREDEDVAAALGIDPVAAKLLAYTVGAAFAGAAGAVFAALIGAVYPHSFQLVVSINVLAILVIGGLASMPGVVVGAAALIGLPELLREFGEFRYLFYGLALVGMMHMRPEGLWPVRRTKESFDA